MRLEESEKGGRLKCQKSMRADVFVERYGTALTATRKLRMCAIAPFAKGAAAAHSL
jgi:hypothetical protein